MAQKRHRRNYGLVIRPFFDHTLAANGAVRMQLAHLGGLCFDWRPAARSRLIHTA